VRGAPVTRPGVVGPQQQDPDAALTSWPDEALFRWVCAGSEPHFNVLYARYFRRIYAFVYQRVRNHADAEELVQETFTVVFRAAANYGGRSSPLAWIYGVAKNLVMNHLRRARVQQERIAEAGGEPLATSSPHWSYGPHDQLTLRRCAAALDEQIAGLADWQAEAFFLRHAENLPIQEISRRTERSADAVRSGLYRVKRLLVRAGALEPESDSP
jgi:RNA polymerase sigma factor (sigma-70 family)